MDFKSYLFQWATKKSLIPTFDIRATGPKHHQRFLCEVRVVGHSFVGLGNSVTKKEAQKNASRDFINYLVRAGEISNPEGGPEDIHTNASDVPSTGIAVLQTKPVFQDSMVQENQSCDGENSNVTYMVHLQQQRNVEEAEDLDVNASLHGNWTMENAKSKLHQFMQVNKIVTPYLFKTVGPNHTRSFRCEMSLYVPQLGRNVTSRETAANKQTASKLCALSLVRQLYHLGIIEAFNGTLKKDRSSEGVMKPYKVAIRPELEQQLEDTLKALNIEPIDVNSTQPEEGQGVTLLQADTVKAIKDVKHTPGVVSWAPPQSNWNAWAGCNIVEEPLKSESLESISTDLEKDHRDICQNNKKYQESLQEREQLPVFKMRSAIMEKINDNPVVIIRGHTGCGKTTQVCQFILDDYIASGLGAHANICVTQPRRISAVSVAERVALERCDEVGNSVGYSVRFESVLPRPYGSILFCTIGVLLRKLEGGLRGVSHVLVDEVHERGADTDFALIVLRDMAHTYPDLRIILMSATVDTALFVEYFGFCPIIEIPGRTYPVTQYFLEDTIQLTKFIPPPDRWKRKSTGKKINKDDDDEGFGVDEEEDLNKNNELSTSEYSPETIKAMSKLSEKDVCFELIEAILTFITQQNEKGAVLIFLPGWSLIFALMKHLLNNKIFGDPNKCLILPLHSQIPREDQKKVFVTAPAGILKVILATNIAETSITINDVVYVIDSCKAKIKTFTSHNNLTSYATVWASKTNLEQRSGRAGRVRPGVCFTLCCRKRHSILELHQTAEMLRTPLHELALSIKLLRLGNIGHFLSKSPEPPPLDTVIEAELLLRELGCLDSNDALTPLGAILAKLPIEPRLGKMIVLGFVLGVGDALTTMSANSTTFPEMFIIEGRRRLNGHQRALAGNRASDHIAMLNAFQMWEGELAKGEDAEAAWCEWKGLQLNSFRVTSEAKYQLINILASFGFPEECSVRQRWNPSVPNGAMDLVIALLCMGLYPNVCLHRGKRKVFTTEGKPALFHKTSVNCSNLDQNFNSPLFVFGEKVRTIGINCKQTTMVAPLHLLLFACRKVEWIENMVRLDNWLNLDMSPRQAALVTALRPAVERLVERAALLPNAALDFSPDEQKIIDCIKELCIIDAGDYNIQRDAPTFDLHPDGFKRGTNSWGSNSPRGNQTNFNVQRGYGHRRGFGNQRGLVNQRGNPRERFEGGFRSRGFSNRGSFYNEGNKYNRVFGRGHGHRGFDGRRDRW